jgi:DNA-binding SARP family transcriptional activator/predicted ATPase
MARLTVRLLGTLQVTLNGEAVSGLESDKARALLAYLAIERERPHRREKLAGLLWSDWTEQSARANLRRVLANLRQVIGDHQATPPFLHISRQTVQFNSASDAWIDVATFTDLLQTSGFSPQAIRQLEQAVELYRGDFLEGFSIGDSPAFEEWVLLNRERLRRLVMEALHRLAQCHERYGKYERSLPHAWRQVELDPWRENAHRQLMRLLALSGQRGAALAQYETCRSLLAEELDVEPAAETTKLYEQIRDGKLKRPMPSPARPPDLADQPPAFLVEEGPVEVERPLFVARERELARLDTFLDLALAGQGRVIFVTGEAGSGKTALVQEFTRRAQDLHVAPSTGSPRLRSGQAGQALVVAGGDCSAYTGIGDPYLPFREILALLTGDVEATWAAGAISGEHARRLWSMLPYASQALVEAGPDLVDTFVLGTALLERAVACAPGTSDWLTRLDELMERKAATGPGAASPQQSDLFEQYTRVLQTLARHAPLVLVVDDLQWADAGSISLLFHLGRQLAGSRILIIGAYRPEEVALGRGGERHPLEPVINEFQRSFGEIVLNLDEAESRDLVEAILDSEPNQLGVAFRRMLYGQTRGHPLFAIELLRGLQERGDLLQDQEGRWVEGPALDWETLPARVEAVIAERIGRLDEFLQSVLRVASVEGETFTAEVVARVRAAGDREMVEFLSGQLDRKHRLVRAQGILRMETALHVPSEAEGRGAKGGQRTSRYRFRHILFQKHLYNSLDQVERAHLHEAVGNTLEGLHEGRTEAMVGAVAGQLAWHFQEAGMAAKAIDYLCQAGDRAVRMSANEEAITHFSQALELLGTLPETDNEEQRSRRAQQELELQLALFAPLEATRGYAAPEVGRAFARARELCQEVEETAQLFRVLWPLSSFYGARAEYRTANEIGQQLLSLAQRIEDPLLIALAHWALGWHLHLQGELASARDHLEKMLDFYDLQQHRSLLFTYGQDPGVSCLAWSSWALWLLGYPDQALKRSQEALALAQKLDHPFSLCFAQCIAGVYFHQLRREGQAARDLNAELMRTSVENGFLFYQAQGTIFLGLAQTEEGEIEEGIAQMRHGWAAIEAAGARMGRSEKLAWLGQASGKAGQAEEGLGMLEEALAHVEETGEHYYEAEILRFQGELLLLQGEEADAETSFEEAIEVARHQQAKSWELRATVSLARLWQEQDRQEEARKVLTEIYGWFTEGFDTPDLIEAQALLEELA